MLGVRGNILRKYELNLFSGLGGDVLTSYFNKNKTDGKSYGKNNGICTTRGLREHSLKI